MYERRYRRTLSPRYRLAWIRQIREMHSLFETKENRPTYWTNHIKSNYDDPKKLWRSMSSVLRRDGATTVPPSLDVTAARLSQFFTDKVDGVRAATENAPPPSFSMYSGTQLISFEDVTAEEVRKFVLGSPIKTCVLDPLYNSRSA